MPSKTLFWVVATISFVSPSGGALQSSVGQDPQSEIFHIRAPEPVYDWVMDEKSARVFASLTNGTAIVEYSVTMDSELRRFELGKKPRKLIIKGNYLVATCENEASIKVINLLTNKLEGTVPFSGVAVSTVFTSRLDDAIVYVVAHAERKYDEPVIHQVDIEKRQVLTKLTEAGGYRADLANAVMSDRGTAFVFDRRRYVTASGGDISKMDFKDNTYRRLTQPNESYGVIKAGPVDRFWTFGSQLVSFETGKLIRPFSGHVVEVHRQLDLAVSLDVVKKQLTFWKFSNARQIRKVELADLETKVKESRRGSKWSFDVTIDDPCLQFDLKNNQVFCAMHQTAFLVPFDDLTGDLQPLLLIDVQEQVDAVMGNTVSIPLKLTNPTLLEGTRFELLGKPASAEIRDNRFVWTPSADDIGERQFTIKATKGNTHDTLVLTARVSGGEIAPEIITNRWTTSPSGKYAALWGMKNTGGRFRPDQRGATEIVIVNLEDEKVIGRQSLTKPVQYVAVNDSSFFVLTQNSSVLYRVDLDDMQKRQRMFLPGNAVLANMLDDGFLLVLCQNASTPGGGTQQVVVDPATLKPVESDSRNGKLDSFGSSTQTIRKLDSGLITDGSHVFDQKTGEVVTIVRPYNLGFPLIENRALQNYPNRMGFSGVGLTKIWGRSYDRTSLRDGLGNPIAQIRFPFAISTEYPIGVGFTHQQKRNGRINTTTGTFEFYDLTDGTVISKQMVFKDSGAQKFSSSSFGSYGQQTDQLVLLGKKARILFNNKIYSVDIPETAIAQAKQPLRIRNPRMVTVDLMKDEASIQFECPGYSNVTFGLSNEAKNIRMDEETGELTISGQDIWNSKLGELANQSGSRFYSRSSSQTQNAKYLEVSRKRYRIPDGKIGVLIPLVVTAKGDDGQSDRFEFCIVGLGDKAIIDKKNAEQLAKQMEQRREMEKRQEAERLRLAAERKERMKAKDIIENESGDSTDNRIIELEKRIRRLEAAIDSLINKIDKLESGK